MEKIVLVLMIFFGSSAAGWAQDSQSGAASFGKQSQSLGTPEPTPGETGQGDARQGEAGPPPGAPESSAAKTQEATPSLPAEAAPGGQPEAGIPMASQPTWQRLLARPLLGLGLAPVFAYFGLNPEQASLVSALLMALILAALLLFLLRLMLRKPVLEAPVEAAQTPDVVVEFAPEAPKVFVAPPEVQETAAVALPPELASSRKGGVTRKGGARREAARETASAREIATQREATPQATPAIIVPPPVATELASSLLPAAALTPSPAVTPPLPSPPPEMPAPAENIAVSQSLPLAATPPATTTPADVPEEAPGIALAGALPPGVSATFDLPGFLSGAKQFFIQYQSAWDRADLNSLRRFSSTEMFVELQRQLQQRGSALSSTEVLDLDAELLRLETIADLQLATVRFAGAIKEAPAAEVESFTEVWKLAKPISGDTGWVLAGIEPAV